MTVNRIRFSVPGVPVPKGRPRASARVVETDDGPKAFVSMHTPAETIAAEKVVLAEFKRRYPRHHPWTGPVMLRFTAVFPIPKSFPKALREAAARGELFHTSPPDKDNVEKLIVDALNGVAFMDDKQVQGGGIKRYGHPARIDVDLDLVEQPDLPLTPSEKRSRQRLAEERAPHARPPAKKNPSKSKSEQPAKPSLNQYPPSLKAAIEAALAKGGERP